MASIKLRDPCWWCGSITHDAEGCPQRGIRKSGRKAISVVRQRARVGVVGETHVRLPEAVDHEPRREVRPDKPGRMDVPKAVEQKSPGRDKAVAPVKEAGATSTGRTKRGSGGVALAPVGECKYCDHRRAVELARVKRWREKQR